ncbi:Uu.00g143580.m01.CDS01 [Anthostomella pinea]|uniref:Uu.00g143580.m01.CDS01 n=1 Tax=Anthostomella pinea TaxID=933095 RepID=A0AAI8YLN1_9PEZI|nr:Uu.00g143580.m01.CDS01 [Anthostomella pinea]
MPSLIDLLQSAEAGLAKVDWAGCGRGLGEDLVYSFAGGGRDGSMVNGDIPI